MDVVVRALNQTAVDDGPVVGVAEVQVGPVVIRNVRLVKRRDGSGFFVGWPGRKNRDTEQWSDVVFVPDRDVYEAVLRALVDANRLASGGATPVEGSSSDREGDVPF
jgi:DNA-binding cell septation regulator SpoVG